jgi:hypothetical protein
MFEDLVVIETTTTQHHSDPFDVASTLHQAQAHPSVAFSWSHYSIELILSIEAERRRKKGAETESIHQHDENPCHMVVLDTTDNSTTVVMVIRKK